MSFLANTLQVIKVLVAFGLNTNVLLISGMWV